MSGPLLIAALLAGCPGGGGAAKDPGDDTAPAGDSGVDTGDDSAADTAPPPDSDGDGVPDDEDCAPLDPAVYPGNTDDCDGVDDDCDGTLDEDAPSWHPDADGDGYGDAATATVDCEGPAGWLADGGDCDDADPAVNPAATEVCDDGVDNDCNGGGCRHESVLSLADAATRVPDDYCADPRSATCARQEPSHLSLGGGCDLDGDGVGELVATVNTRTVADNPEYYTDFSELYVLRSGEALPATLQESWVALRLAHPVGGNVPFCAGDIDGDGADELVLQSETTDDGLDERVLLVGGPWDGATELPAARAELVGPSDRYLNVLAAGGDADGDGTTDLVARQAVTAYDRAGGYQVLVVPTPASGVHDAEAAAAAVVTTPAGHASGDALLEADYDGDGLDDLVVSTYEADKVPAYLHVFPGPVAGALELAHAATTLDNEGDVAVVRGMTWRVATPGDVDGDGLDDLAAANCRGASGYCTVYVLPAPTPGAGSLPDLALGALAGDETFWDVGYGGLGAPGDLDGDGHPDLAVSAAHSTDELLGAGSVLLWYGPPSGTLAASDAPAALVGTTYLEHCATGPGYAVAGLGDFDGDTTPDLAVSCVGSQYHDEDDELVHTLAGIWIVPGLGL